MPFYDVLCKEHGRQEVFENSVPEGCPSCPLCGGKAKRMWNSPPRFVTDFTPGWDMGAGRNFYEKRERDNWLASKGSKKLYPSPKGTKVIRTINGN